MTKTWIDEVESRAEAATPGPWEHGPYNVRLPDNEALSDMDGDIYRQENAVFISSARTDVPRLCKALRMLLSECYCDCGSMQFGGPHSRTCLGDIADSIRKGDF